MPPDIDANRGWGVVQHRVNGQLALVVKGLTNAFDELCTCSWPARFSPNKPAYSSNRALLLLLPDRTVDLYEVLGPKKVGGRDLAPPWTASAQLGPPPPWPCSLCSLLAHLLKKKFK